MDHFIVSARKYRPSTFEEVVGQKAVTNTLKNAIDNNHLAQALLFTGPRGVGKTSCARILAKMVNEQSGSDVSDFAFNIFELDAASNNSVDDIRALNDQVRIPPQTGNYKVYIIDEVHMLSSAAFNAFLKTLEEPPKHAIFILATTEKHKIIPTILSRCQVFDFKRITIQDIKEHLKYVSEKEGVTAEDEALQIIAQKSDGAMRDALSTYDRVVSYCGTNLTRVAVAENLNVLDYETFIETTDFILNGDIPNALIYFNQILARGYDGQHFISGLASHFRDLLVCKNPSTIELLDVSDQSKKAYQKQAESLSMHQLLDFIDLANTCDFNYKLSQNKLLHVEICLMKLASFNTQPAEKKKSRGIIPADEVKAPTSSGPEKKTEVKSDTAYENSAEQKSLQVNETETQPKSSEKYPDLPSEQNTADSNNDKQKTQPQRKSGLSLKSIQYKKNHVNKVAENKKEDEVLDEKFTLEDMKKTWIKYAEIVDKKGEKLLASTLLSDIPQLKEKTIVVNMPNETMKIEILHNKGRILKYIRNSLKNTHIDIEINVMASESKKYVHTSEEKYQHFVEKNPKIELLKQKLDLDY
jgi:DNA polymerase-3 subunit gamma/tau